MRPGAQVGLIAASATAGVVVAYGRQTRGALRPFADVGRVLSGGEMSGGIDPVPVALGLLFHVALMAAWGVLFATVASRLRGWALLLASVLFAAVAYSVHAILPPLLRPGYDPMAIAPRLAVHVMLALSLATGMRLANSGARAADPLV